MWSPRAAPVMANKIIIVAADLPALVEQAAKRIADWKYAWEKDYVTGSDDYIFRNTFRDIKEAADTLAPHDIKFEHECYDVGHLYNLKFCMDIFLVSKPH